MKTNLNNIAGGGYTAPTIEMFEIVTEKGFAISGEDNENPGGGVVDDWA